MKCSKCDGCGKIGSDDEGAPWTFWTSLKPGEDLAVRLGLVVPLTCPACGGSGELPDAPVTVVDPPLVEKIRQAINSVSAENGSNTPDFILANYLLDCLSAFDKASRAREKWYGKALSIGGTVTEL